jgi:hypothetical protein
MKASSFSNSTLPLHRLTPTPFSIITRFHNNNNTQSKIHPRIMSSSSLSPSENDQAGGAKGSRRAKRRFAPLDPEMEGRRAAAAAAPALKGIVFDVDGTLWLVSLFFFAPFGLSLSCPCFLSPPSMYCLFRSCFEATDFLSFWNCVFFASFLRLWMGRVRGRCYCAFRGSEGDGLLWAEVKGGRGEVEY